MCEMRDERSVREKATNESEMQERMRVSVCVFACVGSVYGGEEGKLTGLLGG